MHFPQYFCKRNWENLIYLMIFTFWIFQWLQYWNWRFNELSNCHQLILNFCLVLWYDYTIRFFVSFGFLLVCILHIMFIIWVECNGIKIHFDVCCSFTQDFQHIGKELWRAEASAWYLLYECQNMNCFLHLHDYIYQNTLVCPLSVPCLD